MKTFMIAVVTFAMVGCAGSNPRHMNMSKRHGYDMKQVDRRPERPTMNRGNRRPERPDGANHRQRGEDVQRDGMRERYAEAGRRIRAAIAEGKITKEEGREKMEALRNRASEGRGNRNRKSTP